jgi:hypothetical protein
VRHGVLDEVRPAAGTDDDDVIFFHSKNLSKGGESL